MIPILVLHILLICLYYHCFVTSYNSDMFFEEINETIFDNNWINHAYEILENQHLIFIGDSLSRFQYISLVFALRRSIEISNNENPNPCIKHQHKDWLTFFKTIQDNLYPEEYCDCYRIDDNGFRFSSENRYYKHQIGNNKFIQVSYLQMLGYFPMSGRYSKLNNNSYTFENLHVRMNDTGFLWQGRVFDIFHEIITPLEPTIIIINAGHWAHDFNELHILNRLIQRFHEYSNQTNIPLKYIWRTTSYAVNGDGSHAYSKKDIDVNYTSRIRHTKDETDLVVCQSGLIHCLNVSWTKSLWAENYIDNVHFLPSIYHLFNSQLMRYLQEEYN